MSEVTFKVHNQMNEHADEAYRVLKTNIQYYGFERKLKKILVTSSGHGEGKTSTAINLCISFAKSGLKVLLLDADLHKPMVVKHFGNRSFIGLTNYISGKAVLEEIINSTDMENFFYIPCGPKPTNPEDILSSSRFSQMLDELEKSFDIIIIDSPSIGKYVDAALLAGQADGVLLVLKVNHVDSRRAKTAKDRLEQLGGKIFGVVLNKMDKGYYKLYTNHYDDHGFAKKIRKGWFKKYQRAGR